MPSEISGTPCIFCGQPGEILLANLEDYEHHTASGFSYSYCAQCKLAEQSPKLTLQSLGRYYPEDYHAYVGHASKLARRLKQHYFRKRARKVQSRLKNRRAAVLDVGISNGEFLKILGTGFPYELHGSDLNLEVLNQCPAEITTYHGQLEHLNLPSSTFDAIILNNLLEHTLDPISTMRELQRILKPGGFIFGETPNFSAFERPLFGRYWGGLHVPRHTFLFTPEALNTLAEKSKLCVETVWSELQPAHWAISVQNLIEAKWKNYHRIIHGRDQFFIPLLLLFLPFNLLQNWLGLPTNLGFIITKPDHKTG